MTSEEKTPVAPEAETPAADAEKTISALSRNAVSFFIMWCDPLSCAGQSAPRIKL